MNVYVVLKKDQEEILKRLKEYRKTGNSTQIMREALYEYAEKIFGNYIHTGITQHINERKEQ